MTTAVPLPFGEPRFLIWSRFCASFDWNVESRSPRGGWTTGLSRTASLMSDARVSGSERTGRGREKERNLSSEAGTCAGAEVLAMGAARGGGGAVAEGTAGAAKKVETEGCDGFGGGGAAAFGGATGGVCDGPGVRAGGCEAETAGLGRENDRIRSSDAGCLPGTGANPAVVVFTCTPGALYVASADWKPAPAGTGPGPDARGANDWLPPWLQLPDCWLRFEPLPLR